MKSLFKYISQLALVALISACSTTEKVETQAKVDAPAKVEIPVKPIINNSPPPVAIIAKSVVTQVVVPAHLDPNSSLSKNRSVYFDFDNFQVKDEFKPIVESHGKYVGSQSLLKVKIEGNTDERGGREYNLALGQKRAEAVARALKIYGVKEQQIETISLGSEKPIAAGHDEAAWSKNRRVDISYQVK
jgi:peptidoglycan-associated lipoprotein